VIRKYWYFAVSYYYLTKAEKCLDKRHYYSALNYRNKAQKYTELWESLIK
jgi:hypothetical protein